ncbi:MAG: YtxH domain-containing protein [Acidiferrobacteraceae bacterium]
MMEASETETSGYGMLMTFFGGLVIGYGAALLLAPRSGRETRALLGDYAQSTLDSAKSAVQSASSKVGDFVDENKERARSVQARVTSAGRAVADEVQKSSSTTRGGEAH